MGALLLYTRVCAIVGHLYIFVYHTFWRVSIKARLNGTFYLTIVPSQLTQLVNIYTPLIQLTVYVLGIYR